VDDPEDSLTQTAPVCSSAVNGQNLSQREVLAMAGTACLIFVGVICIFKNYPDAVDDFADSTAYMSVASAIRHWNFRGLLVKQFWGLPYLMAAISTVTRVSDRTALLLISFISYFVSSVLAYRLWGGWVAAFFALLNFDWLQRSFLGGSEPLFMALLFGTFLMVRRDKWFFAATLASLSTVVRPLGFVALVGIGCTLLWKHEYKRFAIAVAIGLAIGAAYISPLWMQFGDPWATVHSYQSPSQPGPALFGIPFHAILQGTLNSHAPWTNLVLTFGWIFFTLAGAVAMLLPKHLREYGKSHPVETLFATGYLLAICSYNFPYWARGTFPRFAIPIIPFVVLALLPWMPKSRYLLWFLSFLTPALAAFSAIGILNVVHVISR
jgi:hypothetical protein